MADDGLFEAEEVPELGPTGRPLPEFPEPSPPDPHNRRAVIVSMCNQKGGVGKTTTTINLGAALVELGRKVLLVDFDPQGSLSVGLGINPHTLERSIYNLLLSREYGADEVIQSTIVPGLDILPSNIDLSAAEVQLVSEVAREQSLNRVLAKLRGAYDYILIDCAPSLGLLTINALTASDYVVMPLECEFFALRGIALLTDTISKVQDRLNPGWRYSESWARCTTPAPSTPARCSNEWWRSSEIRSSIPSSGAPSSSRRPRWPASPSPPTPPTPQAPVPTGSWRERCC